MRRLAGPEEQAQRDADGLREDEAAHDAHHAVAPRDPVEGVSKLLAHGADDGRGRGDVADDRHVRRVQISQTTVNTMMDMMPRRAVALHRLFLIDDMCLLRLHFPFAGLECLEGFLMDGGDAFFLQPRVGRRGQHAEVAGAGDVHVEDLFDGRGAVVMM